MAHEIAARDGASVEEILNRYPLLSIVADPKTSHIDKAEALRQMLRGLKLPNLTERQRQLAELIQRLELPASARLVADPYFEDQKFKLEYKFAEPEELSELINKIQGAFQQQQWQKIFEWYRS